LWGSRSHNTHKVDSDWDYSGIYIADTNSLLGLEPIQETCTNGENGPKPDYQFHEIGKFCRLLLVGNPAIVETLFDDKVVVPDGGFKHYWDWLVEHKNLFLSVQTMEQYRGYAFGQLLKLKNKKRVHTTGGDYNEKWAYHLMRLIKDGQRIANGEPPVVWKEGAERDYLMAIREGLIDRETVIKHAEEQIENIVPKEGLPNDNPKDFLNLWLVTTRKLKQLFEQTGVKNADICDNCEDEGPGVGQGCSV
jgi:predicted nucleotidyltransferase